jgi:hypothetical protein
MTIITKTRARTALIALTLILPASAAHAYVGPGLGLGAIAVILGVIGSVFLAIFAVLWYPIKRMLKKNKTQVVKAAHPPVEE